MLWLTRIRARGKARTAGRQRRPYPEATPKRRAPVALFPPKVLIEPKPQSKPPTPASQPNGIHSLENDDDNDHPVETTRVDKRERTERDWLLDSDLAFARRAGRAMSDTVEGTGGGGNMADIQKTAWWNDLNTSWRAGRIFEKKVQRRLNQRLNGAEGMKNGLGSVLFRKKSEYTFFISHAQ